jgi:hypothetical protein
MLALAFALVGSTTSGQTPNPNEGGVPANQPAEGGEEGGGGGDPLYGYIGTAFLAAGAIFVVCKSARR